jgi:hypothetical protein
MLLLIADEIGESVASLHGTHTLAVHKECGRLIVSVFFGINDP